MRLLVCFGALLPILVSAAAAQPNTADPRAVAEVRAGKRDTANAAWWGFSAGDSTAALQATLDSGAKKVIVPYMGAPWIITPVKLRGNQEVLLEPGVVVLAKKGAFLGPSDSLLTADGVDNLTIRGYGAALRMHKADYQQSPYQKAEWRMGLSLRGVNNVLVEGISSDFSGGDGYYIAGNATRRWSENVIVRDCAAEGNHRQGMSVISAVNLLVENCRFSSTQGTAPESGIDIEPNIEEDRLQNVLVRNCIFENNSGHGMQVYLRPLSRKSAPVSIRFENCLTRMRPEAAGAGAGMVVGAARDDGPQGLIEFVNCASENTAREGALIYDKSASSVKVRFVNCHWHSPWQGQVPNYAGPRVPVLLDARRPAISSSPGGVEFAGCYVYDTVNRPAVQFESEKPLSLSDVSGVIYSVGARTPRARLGDGGKNVNLRVILPAASQP
ncbi:MAG: right-handed parallel beta-helix repeat-containing protein [Bryobacterales bacterium]|nr:right-handed parallel beta-helix repeat-containing protein [Bryobacterales bacterium]